MSVMDMNSRMAMAEKLSVPQLQQAIQSGSIPAYIGIPLIEQKNKERSQMAAAQQGQQKPPSVAASILQQADAQERQERGIDELPSNLPMMEDEEMGMAGGGIVAFAERGRVNDPYAEDFAPSGTGYSYVEGAYDPLEMTKSDREKISEEAGMGINLENDPSSYTSEYVSSLANRNQRAEVPSYLRNVSDRVRKEEAAAQAEAVAREGREKRIERERVGLPMADRLNVPGINPFTPRERVDQGVRDKVPNPPDAFKNDPGYDPVPASPIGRFLKDTMVGAKGELSSYVTRDKLIAPYLKAASGLGDATDTEKNAARTMIRRIAQMSVPELNALAKQDSPTAVAAVEGTSIPARMQPQTAPQVQKFPDEFPEEAASVNAGITAAPGARLAPDGTPGAPRTAPTGTPSAPRTAPQGGAPSSGRGALPPTLAAAERSDSPAANQATSMLDKYVAMLEKSGEDVGRQKKEALYMALIQGGLGMMGGTSPNAFANIAAGMLPATQAYQQALAGIRKDDRARVEKLINAGLSKEKLGMELRKLGIEEKKVDAMVNLYNARAGAVGSGGGSKEDRLVRQGYERSGIEYDRAAQLAKRNMANALKDDSTYTGAKTQLTFAKNLKPEDRTKLEKIIRDREAPYLDDITYNRNMAKGFFKKAGVDLSSGGGGKEDVDLNQFFK
jgi:hypothetical protein